MLSIQRLLKKTYGCLSMAFTLVLVTPQVSAVIPGESQQLVVVTTDGWESTTGRLQTFTRGDDDKWRPAELRSEVVLGRSGLAWGIGLHPLQPGQQKLEGDGKAPAGMFRLSGSFGAEASAPGAMPYLPMRKNHYCIDIPSSPLYNQIVDVSKYPKAMTKGTTEPMRRDLAAKPDDSYRRGLFIDHNPRNQPGAGSCIFMHQIVPEKTATAGCTALPDADLTAIFAWLKPELQPVYLLLPATEYQALRASWHLPALQP